MRDLLQLSLPERSSYIDRIVSKSGYSKLVTFALNKKVPAHRWFYYKEGFSPQLVESLLGELSVPKKSLVLDPFCGAGTTLLACKQANRNAVGFDALPLAVFVSNVKLQDKYDIDELRSTSRELFSVKFGKPESKWPSEVRFINMKKAFTSYARNDLLFFRERIMGIEDEKTRNLFLLGLLSIVVEASNVKRDGGVLRIVKKRHLPPVRYLLKRRIGKMIKDIERSSPVPGEAEASLGDARNLDLESNSVDACITSPPYLNFVDYTKLYALELSLLSDFDLKSLSKKTLKSHVGALDPSSCGGMHTNLLDNVLTRLSQEKNRQLPDIVEGYFYDMALALEELYRVSKPSAPVALVVANACLPNVTVDVDLLLAEIGEHIGFSVEEIQVARAWWCRVHGIVKEKPVRESVVILRKP